MTGRVAIANLLSGATLSRTRKLTIELAGQPFVFTDLEVTLKNTATQEVWVRRTKNVAPQLVLSLYTETYPNGSYEVSARARAGEVFATATESVMVTIANPIAR